MNVKPKFKVGQVVLINTRWYSKRNDRYQRIGEVFPWPTCKAKDGGFGYGLSGSFFGKSYVSGDEVHEKHLKALTSKERGQ